jgi:hypothetical protein
VVTKKGRWVLSCANDCQIQLQTPQSDIMIFFPCNIIYKPAVTRRTPHSARKPATQEQNPLWFEIIIDVRMPWMNHSSPSSKRDSKYVHDDVPRFAISTGFEYLLWHNLSVNSDFCKLVKCYIWSTALFGVEVWTVCKVQ